MTKTVAFLIYPDFQLLDAAGPIGAFEMPTRGVTPSPYSLKVIARTPGLVTSSSGAIMLAEEFGDPAAIDTLVVAGGQGTEAAARDPDTRQFVREVAKTARRVTSVCSGAYVLAAAGLLDGKRATTHWGRTHHFTTVFPKVKLEPDRIWVRDGQVWTSAGVTAGIDLALALIADDLGEAAARRAAQELVVYHRRPGGQSQFSALLEIERPNGRFGGLLAWARERVGEPLGVERLAEEAGMSARNFARAFLAETGVTPAKAVERLRLEVAREQVEDGRMGLEAVARACGFNDPERMRRAFLRTFGQPPQAMRRGAKAAA
jgi:transcriptional regulator GlxA family with amidase domain